MFSAIFAIFFALFSRGNSFAICEEQKIVSNFNATAFQGTWFEIANTVIPRLTFQRNCQCTYAQYKIDVNSGDIKINNTCFAGKESTKPLSIIGDARLTRGPNVGEIEVGFGAASARTPSVATLDKHGSNYLVLKQSVDPVTQAEYVVIGAPCHALSWILSRSPRMSHREYEHVREFLSDRGYWIRLLGLQRTPQDFQTCKQYWPSAKENKYVKDAEDW